jgi:hypothetical protein
VQFAKATYKMYTISKGSIKVKDTKQGIVKKNTQKKPKKQVQVDIKLTITINNKDNKVSKVGNEVINLELRGFAFKDKVQDPFLAEYDYICF